MNPPEQIRTSKFLSYALRHAPQKVGLTLDEAGWADVDALLAACAANGHPISFEDLAEVVRESDKQRFALDDVNNRIRANQGHSIDVDLGFEAADPPEVLYHGTHPRALDAILAEGLKRMSRQHVHLSADMETAQSVGERRGKPIVFAVAAAQMQTEGHVFHCSANGVWLTERVPPAHLRRLD